MLAISAPIKILPKDSAARERGLNTYGFWV